MDAFEAALWIRQYSKYNLRCSNVCVLHVSCWDAAKYLQALVELVEPWSYSVFRWRRGKLIVESPGAWCRLKWLDASLHLQKLPDVLYVFWQCKVHFRDKAGVRSMRILSCKSNQNPAPALPHRSVQAWCCGWGKEGLHSQRDFLQHSKKRQWTFFAGVVACGRAGSPSGPPLSLAGCSAG